MIRYDSVDRLMKMAEEAPSKARSTDTAMAEAELEERFSVAERPAPARAAAPFLQPPPAAESSAADRGRQFLSAIRPFLPAVGSALRLVDHGAVQAVARLLPVLGNFSTLAGGIGGQQKTPESAPPALAPAAAAERRLAAMTEELNSYKTRVHTLEEQGRRIRETVERTVAEQGSMSHTVHQLADRTRLLSASVIILVMLVVAELVLLAVALHR